MPEIYGISDKFWCKKYGISDNFMLIFKNSRIFAA